MNQRRSMYYKMQTLGGIKIVNCADTSVHIVRQGPKQLIEGQEKERNKRNKMSCF